MSRTKRKPYRGPRRIDAGVQAQEAGGRVTQDGTGIIYGLRDPGGSPGLFYVGRTVGTLEHRVRNHATGRRIPASAARYIKAKMGGRAPQGIVLAHEFEDDLPRAEAEWIATCRAAGHPLVNVSEGGPKAADLRAHREALSRSTTAAWKRPEAKARQSAALRRANARPEVRERRRLAAQRAMLRPDVARNRAEAALRRRPRSPEHAAKLGVAHRGHHHTAEAKARISAGMRKARAERPEAWS